VDKISEKVLIIVTSFVDDPYSINTTTEIDFLVLTFCEKLAKYSFVVLLLTLMPNKCIGKQL
jgi:hypothetical protein